MKKIILCFLLSIPFFVMAQQKEQEIAKPETLTITPRPLYILDGKIVAENVVTGKYAEKNSDKLVRFPDTLNPNDIESVTVLKGDSAIVKYGAAAKNGVVVIITKDYQKKLKKF